MTYKVQNIIVGAAALYIGAEDSTSAGYTVPALPTLTPGVTSVTALDASAAFRQVGFTTNGLELNYQPGYTDIEVDQLLDSAKIFKSTLQVTLATTLSEATLENLLVAWGQPTDGLTSTATDETIGIAAGALGDEPVERGLVAVGPGPRSAAGVKRERLYYARRVLSVQASAHALRRNEATVFPVDFRLLPDPTQTAGQEYGIVRDRNIA